MIWLWVYVGLDVAQGQESRNGAFPSHAECALRKRSCELGRVLLVKIFAIGLWSWFCVSAPKSDMFVMLYLDAFIFLAQWMIVDSKARPHE